MLQLKRGGLTFDVVLLQDFAFSFVKIQILKLYISNKIRLKLLKESPFKGLA